MDDGASRAVLLTGCSSGIGRATARLLAQAGWPSVPMAAVRRRFESTVFGPVRLNHLVLPAMRAQRWGRVVNIGSMGGRLTFPGGGYCDDPYRAFTEGVRASTRGAYDHGPLARLAGSPEHVARVVLEAVTAARSRARYPVSASARVLLVLRRLLPDRAWDAFLARQFTRPGTRRG